MVESFAGISILPGLIPRVLRCRDLVVGLPGAWLGGSTIMLVLAWLELPLVGVIDGAVLLFRD